MAASNPAPEQDPAFRWPAVFQKSTEPIFLLSRQRRILFVNRAWEALTGLPLAEVKGRTCRRRPRSALVEKAEIVASALAPPPEALQGQPAQARRQLLLPDEPPAWWQIAYFPLAGDDKPLAILGKISVRTKPASGKQERLANAGKEPPLSEKMLALRQKVAQAHRLDNLPAATPALERVVEQIRLAATNVHAVLIQGETGTGKRWVARAIHEHSDRRDQFFAALDCERLPASAVEALLFHPASAGCAALGTVYMRSLQALPRELQDQLTNALAARDENSALPRIVAGFDAPAESFVQMGTPSSVSPRPEGEGGTSSEPRPSGSGMLSEKLYCRLATQVIALPPLRERTEDFAWWVQKLLGQACQTMDRALAAVSTDATECLRCHSWPGNLHELFEVLRNACARAKGENIELADLPFYLKQTPPPPQKPISLDAVLEQVEKRLIRLALQLAQDNKAKAADLLGIWRPRLLRRIENLGLNKSGAVSPLAPEGERG
ncbi:MAG: sigma 54-interacting transcriptional regulator, partial [Gemmataceae bacterium]|nr:sigma 54-interacting transcriptional regulator [Gemmataceae bacterium]